VGFPASAQAIRICRQFGVRVGAREQTGALKSSKARLTVCAQIRNTICQFAISSASSKSDPDLAGQPERRKSSRLKPHANNLLYSVHIAIGPMGTGTIRLTSSLAASEELFGCEIEEIVRSTVSDPMR